MDETIKQTFELSPQQVKLKEIQDSDFLFLEIKAINDDYPNRNGSHFTLEAMQKALPTFKNKPILGNFVNGDFTAHDGEWAEDENTGEPYWDTSDGEKILGFIRETDSVELVSKGNKNWIIARCAIWIKYCWEQASRLLIKDHKHKKVSVEVEILKKHTDDKGIVIIDDFKLLGITILGSRKGVPVQEGIEGASLDVLSDFESDKYFKQKQALCFAYQELDGKAPKDVVANITKGVNEVDLTTQNETSLNVENAESGIFSTVGQGESNEGITTSFTEQNDEADRGSSEGEDHCSCEDTEPNLEDKPTEQEDCHEEEGEEPQENEPKDENPIPDTEEHHEEGCNEPENDGGEPEPEPEDKEVEHCAELTAKCAEYEEKIQEYERSLSEKDAIIADKDAKIAEFSAQKSELEAEKTRLMQSYSEADAKLNKYLKAEMHEKAVDMMEGRNLPTDVYEKILMEVDTGVLTKEEDLKMKVALASFDCQPKPKVTQINSFSMPVNNVEMGNAHEDRAEVAALDKIYNKYGNGKTK